MYVEKKYEDSCEAKEREMEKLLSTNQSKLDLSVKEDMQTVGLIRSMVLCQDLVQIKMRGSTG